MPFRHTPTVAVAPPSVRTGTMGICLCLMLAACDSGNDADGASPPVPESRWEPLGQLPVGKIERVGSHAPMSRVGDDVLVGTNDGIWRRSLVEDEDWQRSGLAGAPITFVRAHPADPARILAGGLPADGTTVPFYYSGDGGQSWTAAASSAYDELADRYYAFHDLAVSERFPNLLYANLSADTVNVSFDGGINWLLANGESEVNFGYYCHLAWPALPTQQLFQGCEVPLDVVTLARYDITTAAPVTLGEDETLLGIDVLENRRPNVLKPAAADPGLLLVGLEAALLIYDIETGSARFPYRTDGTDGADDYATYIRGIWSHPDDVDTILFGGSENGKADDRLELYRTTDGGDTVELVDGPEDGLPARPKIEQLLAGATETEEEQAVLVLITDEEEDLHLFRYITPG